MPSQIPTQPQMHQSPNSQTTPQKKNFFKENKFKIFIGVVIILILIIALVLSLNTNKKPEIKIPPTVTIDFWGTSVDEDVMNELIKDFESQNPYIKVKYEKQTDSLYKDRLQTRLQKGDSSVLPDIAEIEESWIFEGSGYAKIQNSEITNRFSNSLLKNNTSNGSLYGVPYKFNSLVLAYNSAHLNEKGFNESDFNQLDWSGLKLRAANLVQTELKTNSNNKQALIFNRGGIAIGSPKTVKNADKILELLLMQNDSTIYDSKTKKFVVDLESIGIMDFYTKFATENLWDDSLGNDIEAFANGKASMILAASEDIDKIEQLNPNLNFNTVMPAKISTVKNISFSNSLSIPSSSPYSAQAVEFIKYLTDESNMTKLYSSDMKNTFVPANQSSLNRIDKNSHFAVFSDLTPTAERFNMPKYNATSKVLTNFLLETFNGYYLSVSPDRASKNTLIINPKELESELNNALK